MLSIVLLFKKFEIVSVLKPLKYTLISTIFTVLVAGLSYGVSRLAAVIK